MIGPDENHGLGRINGRGVKAGSRSSGVSSPKDWKPYPKCEDCGDSLVPQILSTCGYYIGTQCQCGPNSRESGYFKYRADAEKALASGLYGRV